MNNVLSSDVMMAELSLLTGTLWLFYKLMGLPPHTDSSLMEMLCDWTVKLLVVQRLDTGQ